LNNLKYLGINLNVIVYSYNNLQKNSLFTANLVTICKLSVIAIAYKHPIAELLYKIKLDQKL
jgi:hypothetical protein